MDSQDVQRLQAIPAGSCKKRASLLRGERVDLSAHQLGDIHGLGDVVRYETPPYRLLKRPVYHRVYIADAGGSQSFVEFGAVQALHMSGGQVRELDPS
jgi:hypothetical protein